MRGADRIEHTGQHAGPVQVPHHQRARCRSLARQVHHIGHLPGIAEGLNDAHRLRCDGFLRLLGGGADVVRPVDQIELGDRVGEFARAARRLLREHV
jgi:hypothetical protein